MASATPPPAMPVLTDVEWEVLYLLFDGLDQLRKLTLSFSEIRYLATDRTEPEISAALEGLLLAGPRRGVAGPLAVAIPNLTNLPIYRITPFGRRLVQAHQSSAQNRATI